MLEIVDVTKRFGGTEVLKGVTLSVAQGRFVSLLGPSGCGKSTTLRIMAGLEAPTTGRVLMGGVDVTDLGPAERNVAMVFQSYALYPHMTVRQNMMLPLAMRRLSRLERSPLGRAFPAARAKRAAAVAKVAHTADTLGLGPLLDRKPGALSGGQKQRVALGRALVRDPSIFLLDEPLSNLDARLRVDMRAELVDLHRRTGVGFVYVTHDQTEAMAMSDVVAVVLDGRIAQVGPPRTLYERPASVAVASFLGTVPMALIEVAEADGRLGPPLNHFVLEHVTMEGAAPQRVVVGLNAEHVTVGAGPIPARVLDAEDHGARFLVRLGLDGGAIVRAEVPVGSLAGGPGAAVRIDLTADHAHVFDAADGRRLDARRVPAGVAAHAPARAATPC